MLYLALALGIWVAQDDGPAGTITLNDGAKATRLTSIRVDLKLTSPGAGDVHMSITVEGQPPGPWVPFREVSFHDLPAGDGEKKITLRLKDRKGKDSAPVTATIRLDTVAPTLKVEAPAKVQGFEARLVLESPDAVALQYTENVASWSAWEPFSTPKTIALSKGAGAKQVFVRVKDEAGNESIPSRVLIEAQDPTAPAAAPGLGSLSLGLRKGAENLELTVWVYGSGLTEMQAELDQVEVLSRQPYKPSITIPIQSGGGSRRLVVKAWDAAGREHRAEAVFLDQEVTALPPPEEVKLPWRLDVLAGVLPVGLGFHARTANGDRDLERGPIPVFRVQGAWEMGSHLYLQLGLEAVTGSEIRIFSGGLDFGVRSDLGELWDAKIQLRTELGAYYSRLEVTTSGFGNFDPGPLVRAGVALGAQVGEGIWTELLLDFRYAWYRFGAPVPLGDKTAGAWSGAVMLGLSWRF